MTADREPLTEFRQWVLDGFPMTIEGASLEQELDHRLAALLAEARADAAPPPAGIDVDGFRSVSDWMHALILHAEAVHGCEHTTQARADMGLARLAPQPTADRNRDAAAVSYSFADRKGDDDEAEAQFLKPIR